MTPSTHIDMYRLRTSASSDGENMPHAQPRTCRQIMQQCDEWVALGRLVGPYKLGRARTDHAADWMSFFARVVLADRSAWDRSRRGVRGRNVMDVACCTSLRPMPTENKKCFTPSRPARRFSAPSSWMAVRLDAFDRLLACKYVCSRTYFHI